MSSPRIALILPIAAATLALTGCVGIDAGRTTAQTRDVDAFTRLSAEDEVDVNLRVGESRELRVRAGEKVIDDIRTEVRDGTLYVAYDGPSIRDGRLLVEVAAPAVEAIAISGSSDVRVEGLAADAFDIRVSGAGDLEAAGHVQRLDVDISGAGDADLAELTAADAHVELSGSGDAEVHATGRLDAEVSGAGDLAYRGDPSLREDVSGSGEIDRIGT
jgi:Putative auto-transporter adhesin, head GIN domain